MNLIPIDDPRDPRVSAYLDIRERDLVGRQGRFVAEGKVVLDLLLSAVTYADAALRWLGANPPNLEEVREALDLILESGVRAGEVMDRIAGFHMHRGILAIGVRGDATPAYTLLEGLPRHALAVVLVGISNHDNMGAIFRNAAAFGADAVLLDRTCCDPLYRKAIRVSVGAALKVPFASFDDTAAFTATLDRLGFSQFALSPRGTTDIRVAQHSARLALYLGRGLPPDLLTRLHTVRIAMAEGFDSLNVAAASAIALHHFSAR